MCNARCTSIDDADAAVALRADATVVTRLGGGCQMPIGVLAESSGAELTVRGVVVSPDGSSHRARVGDRRTAMTPNVSVFLSLTSFCAAAPEISSRTCSARTPPSKGIQP